MSGPAAGADLKGNSMQIIQLVFSVYDQAAGSYGGLILEDTVGLAMRGFQTVADDETTTIHRDPQDFSLFYLGRYNHGTGVIKTGKIPVPIMNAKTGACVDADDPMFTVDLSSTVSATLESIRSAFTLDEEEKTG